jgi:hypothetical protein
MSLNNYLQRRKNAIKDKWLRQIAETYPDRTAVFLKQKRNQFDNPVGHILTINVEIILQKFLEGADPEEFQTPLNEIIKVRSVQGFSPSQAIRFVYLLKDVIRNEVSDQVQDRAGFQELAGIEDRIDELACKAFDLYMQSREQIYTLRVNEVKRTGFRLLQKADILSPETDSETSLT